MSQRDHTQEALDEYYTTGIDPTGGEIADDLDEQEVAFYEEEKVHPWEGVQRPQKQRLTAEEREAEKKASNQWTLILVIFMVVLGIMAIIL